MGAHYPVFWCSAVYAVVHKRILRFLWVLICWPPPSCWGIFTPRRFLYVMALYMYVYTIQYCVWQSTNCKVSSGILSCTRHCVTGVKMRKKPSPTTFLSRNVKQCDMLSWNCFPTRCNKRTMPVLGWWGVWPLKGLRMGGVVLMNGWVLEGCQRSYSGIWYGCRLGGCW